MIAGTFIMRDRDEILPNCLSLTASRSIICGCHLFDCTYFQYFLASVLYLVIKYH